jgi:hypothetical protein
MTVYVKINQPTNFVSFVHHNPLFIVKVPHDLCNTENTAQKVYNTSRYTRS